MVAVVLAALAGSLAVSFLSARNGLLGVIMTGFLQDVARKVVPGEPVWLEGLVWIALVLTLIRYGLERGSPFRIARRLFSPRVRGLALVFFALVILQAIVALVRTGSGVVPLIGTLAYAGPVLAVAGAAAFLKSPKKLELLFAFYVVLCVVNAVGVILSFRGVENALLDTVGGVMLVYRSGDEGGALRLIPGFLRSAEVSSWHCATAAILCVTFARAVHARRRALRAMLLAAVPLLIAALVLTGRRKMVAALILTAVVQILIETVRRQGGWRVALGAALVVVVLVMASNLGFTKDVPAGMEGYVERSRTLRTDWLDRAQMTVDSLFWTAWASGFLGQGTGMTSQGSQHYVEVDETVLGASETGPSKVMTELGLAGLVLLTLIGFRLFNDLRRAIDSRAAEPGTPPIWEAGLFSLLVANGAVFAIAHQVFGDPFVLLMLGVTLGALLVRLHRQVTPAVAAMPRLPEPELGRVRA